MSLLDGGAERGREALAKAERRRAFLESLRQVVREEVRAKGATCLCGLEDEDRKAVGHLIHMCRDVGIENIRDNHQFVEELRRGADHVKLTALTVAVGSALTAVGAGLFLLFKAKVGN